MGASSLAKISEANEFWHIFGGMANSLVFLISGVIMGTFYYEEGINKSHDEG